MSSSTNVASPSLSMCTQCLEPAVAFCQAPGLDIATELVSLDSAEGKREGKTIDNFSVRVVRHFENVFQSADALLNSKIAIHNRN